MLQLSIIKQSFLIYFERSFLNIVSARRLMHCFCTKTHAWFFSGAAEEHVEPPRSTSRSGGAWLAAEEHGELTRSGELRRTWTEGRPGRRAWHSHKGRFRLSAG